MTSREWLSRCSPEVQHAFSLLHAGSLTEALRIADAILASNTNDADALLCRGVALFRLGNRDEALTLVDGLTRRVPASAIYWTHKGVAHFLNDDTLTAEQCVRTALAIDPGFDEAWNLFGNIYLRGEKLQDALRTYRIATDLDPEIAGPWLGIAVASRQLGDLIGAVEAYDRALALEPHHIVWCNRASVLSALGEHKLALASFEEALTLDPACTQAWEGQGQVLLTLGRDRDALASFACVLELAPRSDSAWINHAAALIALDRYQEAYDDTVRALTIRQSFGAYHNLSRALTKLGRYADALKASDDAIALAPGEPLPWLGKATTLLAASRNSADLDEGGRGATHSSPGSSEGPPDRAIVHPRLIAETRRYLLRWCYLSDCRGAGASLMNLMWFFGVATYSPFILRRLFERHSVLDTCITYQTLLERALSDCDAIDDVMRVIELAPDVRPTDRLASRILGLFLSDDQISLCRLLETIDPENNLFLHYYRARCYEDTLHDHRDAALTEAVTHSDKHSGLTVSDETAYYMGLIYLHVGRYNDALSAFSRVGPSAAEDIILATKYAVIRALSLLDDRAGLDAVIVDVLAVERERHSRGSKGFLFGLACTELDFTERPWTLPFRRVAYASEVGEGIQLVREYLDNLQSSGRELPTHLAFANQSRSPDSNGLATWTLMETSRQLLGEVIDNQTAADLTNLRLSLEATFSVLDLDVIDRGRECEATLADWIQKDTQGRDFLPVIRYCVMSRRLTPVASVLLAFEWQVRKSARKASQSNARISWSYEAASIFVIAAVPIVFGAAAAMWTIGLKLILLSLKNRIGKSSESWMSESLKLSHEGFKARLLDVVRDSTVELGSALLKACGVEEFFDDSASS